MRSMVEGPKRHAFGTARLVRLAGMWNSLANCGATSRCRKSLSGSISVSARADSGSAASFRATAIEIDGEGHSMGNRPQRDLRRDAVLSAAGFETLRIAARDVLDNLDAVMTHILVTCRNRPLHRSASLIGPPPSAGIPTVLTDRWSLEAGFARSGED